MRRVGDPRLNHNSFDDLPDHHPPDRPDRARRPLAGALRFAKSVGGVHGVQVIRRNRGCAVDDPRRPGRVPALLQAAARDRAAREVDAGRRDLEELRGPTAGPVQRLAERPVPSGPGDGPRRGRPPAPRRPGRAGYQRCRGGPSRSCEQNAWEVFRGEPPIGPLPRSGGLVLQRRGAGQRTRCLTLCQ